jgi:hypothetical protein
MATDAREWEHWQRVELVTTEEMIRKARDALLGTLEEKYDAARWVDAVVVEESDR